MKRAVIYLLLAAPLAKPAIPRWLLRTSQVAWVVAGGADVAYSRGLWERNPALGRGPFGVRQIGVKLGVVGGWLVVQEIVRRRRPDLTVPIAVGNFAGAAVTGGAAVRNWRVRR